MRYCYLDEAMTLQWFTVVESEPMTLKWLKVKSDHVFSSLRPRRIQYLKCYCNGFM